jgi:hypothetical protein
MWLQPVDYSDEQSAYFAALGRATALAQNFEQNCKFVFGTLDMGRDYEDGKIPIDQWRAHGTRLHGRSLGAALKPRQKDADFSAKQIATLEAGRAGRNYLAHQAAEPGLYVPSPLGKPGKRKLDEFLRGTADPVAIEKERAEMRLGYIRKAAPSFEAAVRAVAEADKLVAGWSYLIEEEENRLPSDSAWYVSTVVAWVLEPLRIAGISDGPRS